MSYNNDYCLKHYSVKYLCKLYHFDEGNILPGNAVANSLEIR